MNAGANPIRLSPLRPEQFINGRQLLGSQSRSKTSRYLRAAARDHVDELHNRAWRDRPGASGFRCA
jgi:hypothetical protein